MEEKTLVRKLGLGARLLGWFRKKSSTGKVVWSIIFILLVVLLIIERGDYSPILVIIRKYAAVILLLVLIIWGVIHLFKWSRTKGKIVVIILSVLVIGISILVQLTPWALYSYVSSYVRYQTIKKLPIVHLPETAHEVIQPRISIQTLAEQRLQETETVSRPYLVRDQDSYRWTMAKEPSKHYMYQRFSGQIKTIFSVSSEAPSPNFSKKNQAQVEFSIGQTLLFSRQVHTATMKNLSLLDLFSIEADEPRFMRDDSGVWVQVVPLIRWRGIFFPQPEFGGVHVIKQGSADSPSAFFKRVFFGAGVTYSPEEMKKFSYLENQNLVPKKVTESIAKSFRFQKGFLAPLPMYHDGDVRIPIIKDGISEQPMTTFFKMSVVYKGAKDMLYEYYGLEPYDTSKTGLITSLFIPSDGEMTAYVYQHGQDGLAGASAVPSRVRESKMTYDWSVNKVAGIRAYNRIIDGEIRSFWCASVVTRTQDNSGYVSGGLPATAVIDSKYDRVVWVAPDKIETWPTQLKDELGASWRNN